MSVVTKEEALERLKQLCGRSEKCLADVRKKLSEWNIPETFEEISNTLLEENFIDESRYSISFVNDKVRFSKWGFTKIRYHLRSRQISNSLIELAIKKIPEKDYKQIVFSEVLKKNRSVKEADAYKRMQKLYAFGASRGYEGDLLRLIINDLEI